MTTKKTSKKKAIKKADNEISLKAGEKITVSPKMADMDDDFMASTVLKTAHGELTHAYLEEFKLGHKSWATFSERDQEFVIDRCKRKAEHTLRKMFALVSQKGFESTTAIIESVNFKKGAKIAMNCNDNDGAHKMADRINQQVLVVFVDPKEYLNGKGLPLADADQKTLDVD